MQNPQIKEKQLRCDHWFSPQNGLLKCVFCDLIKQDNNFCGKYFRRMNADIPLQAANPFLGRG